VPGHVTPGFTETRDGPLGALSEVVADSLVADDDDERLEARGYELRLWYDLRPRLDRRRRFTFNISFKILLHGR
jgi:hypothetical protein